MTTSTPNRTRKVRWEQPPPEMQKAMDASPLAYFRGIRDGQYPRPPLAEILNLGLGPIEEGFVVFTMEPAEYHYNPLGTVHGGVIATLLDSAMGSAVMTKLPPGAGFTTLEIKVNYLKSVTESTGPVFAEGRVIHSGRSSAVAEGRLVDASGKLYALATTTCAVLQKLAPAA